MLDFRFPSFPLKSMGLFEPSICQNPVLAFSTPVGSSYVLFSFFLAAADPPSSPFHSLCRQADLNPCNFHADKQRKDRDREGVSEGQGVWNAERGAETGMEKANKQFVTPYVTVKRALLSIDAGDQAWLTGEKREGWRENKKQGFTKGIGGARRREGRTEGEGVMDG